MYETQKTTVKTRTIKKKSKYKEYDLFEEN